MCQLLGSMKRDYNREYIKGIAVHFFGARREEKIECGFFALRKNRMGMRDEFEF